MSLEFDPDLTADGYYTADSIEAISTLCSKAVKSGVTIFNLISAEDLIIRENRVTGLVLNWTAVEMANLHVDPLTIQSKFVVDATGHATEVVAILQKKNDIRLFTETGKIVGEKSLWAEAAEKDTMANTREVFPGLYVAVWRPMLLSGLIEWVLSLEGCSFRVRR